MLATIIRPDFFALATASRRAARPSARRAARAALVELATRWPETVETRAAATFAQERLGLMTLWDEAAGQWEAEPCPTLAPGQSAQVIGLRAARGAAGVNCQASG